MTMMMIAQGAVKAGQAGSRLLKPKFGGTAYGRMLKKRQTQGNLTPGQESIALGRTAETATKQANLANKRYMGSMINKGLQGSVSAQRGLREAEADVRRTVADTGKDIYQSEEQAKSKAKLDYARAMDQDKSERRQALIGTVGAIGETALKAGATEYGARETQRLKDLPKGVDKILQDFQQNDDPAKLFGRLLESGMSRESAKDLMRFLQNQGKPTTKPENIDIMSPQYRVNQYTG